MARKLCNKPNQPDTHFTFTSTLLVYNVWTCFGHYLPIIRRHYTNVDLVIVVCSCRCVFGLRISTTAHNSHQFCVRVVPPEDGQVMPKHVEKLNINKVKVKVKVKCVSGWLCLLRNYVTMTHSQQNITIKRPENC
jgi:hypothetical protein